jgi:hypothetical protein
MVFKDFFRHMDENYVWNCPEAMGSLPRNSAGFTSENIPEEPPFYE